jgi:predicted CXXCH cytochrome family protein
MSDRWPRRIVLALAFLTLTGGPWAGSALAGQDTTVVQRPFPHARHVGLFPTCDGCHAGILSGDSAKWLSVGPEFCQVCHDGETVKKIEWTTPEHPRTNLHFTHAKHAAGLEKLGAPPAKCQTCHQAEGGTTSMQVVMARPTLCGACHSPDHLSLQNDCATCHDPLTRASKLRTSDIAGLPKPPWHDSADFLFEHGAEASASGAVCSVCHARQSCTRCHLNASQVEPIQALGPDPRVAQLVQGRAGQWPEPPSHRDRDWVLSHGETARTSLSTCADCHAASSCATCHRGPRAGFLSQMPRAVEGGPSGVRIHASPPGHGPGFATQHGATAASGAIECSACHTKVQCTACHRGGVPSSPAVHAPGTGGSGGGNEPMSLGSPSVRPGEPTTLTDEHRPLRRPEPRPVVWFASLRTTVRTGPQTAGRPASVGAPVPRAAPDTTPPATDSAGQADRGAGSTPTSTSSRGNGGQTTPAPRTGGFHPPDYVLRHGADAFSRRVQCSECHSAQAFCLTCHEKEGIGRGGTAGSPAFHDAEPNWLIVHGRAARQNMETCTSCHQQSSCLRCHSAKFGFRIDPHGPGFDPNRIADRSTISCGICHFSIPKGGGGG